MTPREAANRWISSHFLQIVVYAVSIGAAWALLTAAVHNKAEKADVVAITFQVQQMERDANADREVLREGQKALRDDLKALERRVSVLVCWKNPNPACQ